MDAAVSSCDAMSIPTTLAPSRARRCATARPIPAEAPLTTATRGLPEAVGAARTGSGRADSTSMPGPGEVGVLTASATAAGRG
jgi:hypothetical protein